MNTARASDGKFTNTHGMRNSRLYKVWCAMKERCNNPHNKRYDRYGGRGITVCAEWVQFEPFYKWAKENGYEETKSIDRINNDKGYSPENCRWVTRSVQNRNYSRNHLITHNGETKCLCDWAVEYGINRSTLLLRLKSGKTVEQALTNQDGRKTRWQTTLKP